MARTSAVRPEEIRRHNLGLLLGEIHRHGELTRAELTSVLGLNRSTIGGLVTDLVNLGMVTEYVPAGRDRAGRPSYVVAPRSDGPYVLAVEVDVERIVSAAVGLGGTVHARRETPIDGPGRAPEAVARQIVRDATWLAGRLPTSARLIGVGVSVPGTVSRQDGFIEHAPNLDWRGVPLASLLSDRLGGQLEIRVGNDADLGALAEHLRGAAVGLDNVVFINGSVGVGGGIIADGSQLRGVGGYAGEIGHIMLNPDGPPCHCGSTGCIETYIGEHALLRAAGIDRHGPAEVAGVFASAHAGDPRAVEAVRTVAVWLGRTLATLVNVFNPQAIIVGGSLAEVLRLERQTIETEIDHRAMSASRCIVQVLPPGLGPESSLIGASELAFQTLLAAPDSPVIVVDTVTASPVAN
ncbi:ROK family protein [Jatrophihabitans sp. DSM 45814]